MAIKQSAQIEGLKAKGVDIVDDAPTIEPVTKGDFKKIADDEAFMHESVVVMLFPTTDANAPPYALINVNGDRTVIRRSEKTVIKRKHLEVLARMKETRWAQAIPDGYVGQIGAESLRGHTALAYPFQVLEDKNPRGMAWLEHVLAEAA
jgi:hypothetical protein